MGKLDKNIAVKLVNLLNASIEFFDCDEKTYPFIQTFRGKLCIYIPYKEKWGVAYIENIDNNTLFSEMHKLKIEFNHKIRNEKEPTDGIYIIG